jgi:hypothetical protein
MSSSTSISEAGRSFGLRLLGAFAIGLALVAAMELVLRMLPVVSGVHRENPPSPAASARLVAHRDYTWSLGWDLRHVVSGRTNGMGFLSPHEYTSDARAVALIGDSFVEAQMLRYDESLAGHLDGRWRGEALTYNFGLSGAALPHYLGIAGEMGARFRFAAAIVVVTPWDYVEGFESQEGVYQWGADPRRELVKLVPSTQRSRFVRVARELALVRYMRSNLKLSAQLFMRTDKKGCVPQPLAAVDRERLARYVDALPRALQIDPQKIVMVFNAPAADIYERVDRNRGPAQCADLDSLARAELARLAAERGMKLVDVGRLLEVHYRMMRRPLDLKPADSHWNGAATDIVAGEIVRVLAREIPERAPTGPGQITLTGAQSAAGVTMAQ